MAVPFTKIDPIKKSNYMHSKVWDGITYPFPNFNGCTVCGWIRNFIPQFIMGVITHPCWMKVKSIGIKGIPDLRFSFVTQYSCRLFRFISLKYFGYISAKSLSPTVKLIGLLLFCCQRQVTAFHADQVIYYVVYLVICSRTEHTEHGSVNVMISM